MLIYGVEGRFVPALKKANQDPKFLDKTKSPKNLATFTDPRVKTLPLMPEWEEFTRDVWNPGLERLWKGEVTAKELVVDVARRTNEMIKNREQY
jgi:ABC-type glycerol-3-phosphate transport system substrate-binding protein